MSGSLTELIFSIQMPRWLCRQISDSLAAYVLALKEVAVEALSEEAVLISVEQVYHAV